ncbi:hypothetical protein HSRCO_2035 [Halanaeroarchaeum sp. HSR-CO]|uniref:hypothetical protein n=1 Tax=Halanaeroarchaeum sp. HSR-CO TaxID=2866382 RepID=UPI00217EF724|nr:hypothetical protein [Halanaeroarchaeum sp. HSR-CO]UWG48310.1 hypothetical protein HSRCO_2035 [Halanaeroarchaeum sp. HSR-CO]
MYKLAPTVSAAVGPISDEIELEAWVTTTGIAATCCFDYTGADAGGNTRANYNNTRSNRSTIRGPDDADADADGLDDAVEARSHALDLEHHLLSQTNAAADSISKRSARTGRRGIAVMGETIENVRATLERCSGDVCVTVREHADHRAGLTRQAAAHVENGEWDAASDAVEDVRVIVEADITLLESSLDDGSEGSVSNPRLQALTGASAEVIGALYEYLAGEPVLSEQFTVTVPDARLSAGNVALVDELTPRRIIEYVTGRADDDGHVYAWGKHTLASGNGNTSPLYEGSAVGGENALNRPGLMNPGDDSTLYNADAFRSAVSEPVDTDIHLETSDGNGTTTVHVQNDPPQATETTPALAVSADGSAPEPADFDDWGPESGDNGATSTLVCPVMVAPPDCPSPFPALLYVRRCKHADQYIYTGGWVIDDGSLYENSVTLVAVGSPTEVIGVDAGDVDGDGYGDVMARHLSGDRQRRGARLFDGTVSDAVAEGVLSEAAGEDIILRKRPGRSKTESGDDGDAENTFVCRVTHLTAPIVHYTRASASDTVKFKAGAELSKSVN